ncbi:MAG: ribbon-helix-helix domain-containing protein [Thermoplasmata archaeon]
MARREPVGPEDERIALRCHRKELQLVDSFVASGEFASRSELMRAALREFLRARASSAIELPRTAVSSLVEASVRLRPDEIETYSAYGKLVANGRTLSDILAELVRRGDLELKVSELVQHARESVRRAVVAREQLDELNRSGEDLERKGVVGR